MPRHNLSGLSLYAYRAYDPNFQRWLNQDPIQEAGGINLYRFNRNDPIDYIDPTGRAPQLTSVSYNPSTGQSAAGYTPYQFGQGYGIGYNNPAFTSSFSGGVLVSGEVEGGVGPGAGAQWSGGGGLFYDPQSGVTAGGFQSAGAAAGVLTYSVSAVESPSCPGNKAPVVFAGSSIGAGSGFWFSNAGSPTDLGGPFDQMNFNTSLFSISYAQSGDTWIFGFTTSGGAKYTGGGFSGSGYPTTTYSAGGFNLLTGRPVEYVP